MSKSMTNLFRSILRKGTCNLQLKHLDSALKKISRNKRKRKGLARVISSQQGTSTFKEGAQETFLERAEKAVKSMKICNISLSNLFLKYQTECTERLPGVCSRLDAILLQVGQIHARETTFH